jgi:hypothetical protein
MLFHLTNLKWVSNRIAYMCRTIAPRAFYDTSCSLAPCLLAPVASIPVLFYGHNLIKLGDYSSFGSHLPRMPLCASQSTHAPLLASLLLPTPLGPIPQIEFATLDTRLDRTAPARCPGGALRTQTFASCAGFAISRLDTYAPDLTLRNLISRTCLLGM